MSVREREFNKTGLHIVSDDRFSTPLLRTAAEIAADPFPSTEYDPRISHEVRISERRGNVSTLAFPNISLEKLQMK